MLHNDSELIQRTLSGDDHAFSLLVEKYQKQVHALAWRIVGDFHIAEEITQDAFLKAYVKLKNLKEPQRFAGWISVLTRRHCLAWLRKKRVWTQSLEHLEQTDNEQLAEAVYSEYVIAERERTAAETQREVVKKLLAKLKESERTVITLHYFGEMSCAEIGEFLGVSANTVKSRLRRAQQRLKKHEPIIREALDNFKITPNLTENIMHEISQTKPAAPAASKPFIPWLFAASTVAVVLLTLGFGNSVDSTRFQQPYSFESNSEIPIDIVEAPIMKNFALKSNVRKQIGHANAQNPKPILEQYPNAAPSPVDEAHADGTVENYPQWNLPEKAKARLGKGNISTIQFSPDGTQLAVGSRIGVWIYDVKTGEEIALMQNMRWAVAYSPDGRFIAAHGGDPSSSVGGTHLEKGVVLWDVAIGHPVTLQDTLPAAAASRFSNDSKTLIFLSLSRDTIYRVDVETGETTTTKMEERPGSIHLENYALTEDKIAIGSRDGKVELWDTTTGKKLSTLRNQTEKEVRFWAGGSSKNRSISLAFSPDRTILANGNLDGTVQMWDTTTGEELTVLNKKMDKMKMLIHTPDGKLVTNEPWGTDNMSRPTELAFSPDGKILAIGSNNSSIQLWDIATNELITTFTGHIGSAHSLAFSADGNTLASGSSDGTVRFWDIKTKKPLQTSIAGHTWVRTAAFLKDSSTLASVLSNGITTVWDLKTSQKTTHITKKTLEIPMHWYTYVSLALSPDGTKLLTYGFENNTSNPHTYKSVIRLTDVNTGRDSITFSDKWGADTFSPDGKTLAGMAGDKIYLFNIETGEERKISLSDHDEDSDDDTPIISSLMFSPDGKKIVSGTIGGHVQLWDVETGNELSSFFGEQPPEGNTYQEPIQNFAFSSDGSLLAVGSTKRIRMIGRAKQPHFKEIPKDSEAFIFSPDNTILIAGYWGGPIRLWDVPTGDELTTLDAHLTVVQNLIFSPDNKTLVSVGDGTILLWDWDKVLASARGRIKSMSPR